MTNPPSPVPQPGYPVAPRTNTFAIVAIVTVWFGAILGLIFGYIALSQIKRSGEGGRGLALAAVIIAWVAIACGIIFSIVFFSLFAASVSNGGS